MAGINELSWRRLKDKAFQIVMGHEYVDKNKRDFADLTAASDDWLRQLYCSIDLLYEAWLRGT